MTYLQNNSANVESFLDITSTQIQIVFPNKTENRIENPSFEVPLYRSQVQGDLSQYNWRYVNSSGENILPNPVTFHHAYSGSFAWKVRMTNNNQIITYGQTKAIQSTIENGFCDILSFYCYCVEDSPTYLYDREDYAQTITSKTHEFVVKVYGINKLSYINDNPTAYYVGEHTFTLDSLPKNLPGDLDIGLSGSKSPHFYPWSRVVFTIPESVKNYKYFYFTINKVNSNPTPITYDTNFVIDAVQLEKQPIGKSATMYFDGSYENFNTRQYPYQFQWTGEPYASTSMRADTRVNGELIDVNDYCNFYVQDISGLSSPKTETELFTKTFEDGQHFVNQIIRNESIVIKGRIITQSEELFMESFARFHELIGKRPFSEPEPVRMVFTLSFTNGVKMLPVYLDVAYNSGLEQETANVFQSQIEITFDVISTHLQYSNDSSSNMFNDSPLFDQFNTMNVDVLRNAGGLFYYNKSEEKWEIPGGIGIFKLNDIAYTSTLQYGGSGVYQNYASKSEYTVGTVNVMKEDGDGILWIGGDFDTVEFDAYYVNVNNQKVNTKLQCRVNNVFGIRKRVMSGKAYVLQEINSSTISERENGPNLEEVEYVSEWQIIVLLDAPSRYSHSEEENPLPFIGIPKQTGAYVNAIEFTPDGAMYIGGKFVFTYGGRRFVNILKFAPYGSDSANVKLYIPEDAYGYVGRNLTTGQLANQIGRGRYRTYWVNSAIPYVKYGVFEDIGRIGGDLGDNTSLVKDIVYDYLNECLYIGGTFVEVANRNSPQDMFYAMRIVRYNIYGYNFLPLNDGVVGAGIQPNVLTLSSSYFVNKIALQYLPSGVSIIAVGSFTKVGKTSDALDSFGIAIITNRYDAPSSYTYRDTGGGGFRANSPSNSATFYDVIVTNNDRVFVAGDFNRLNRNITPYVKVTGIAEYRYGNFVDITRGMDADYYDDTYDDIPAVRSMASNSLGEIYFAGNFSNIKNRQIVDGLAKWNGNEFTGVGMYFVPQLAKILQKVYVDQGDNVFLFTGPNVEKTTVLNSLLTNLSAYSLPAKIDSTWTQYPYSVLKSIFKDDALSIEFYSYETVGGKKTKVSGSINAVCRVGPETPNIRWYADEETVFIAGKFDYIKIADTELRVNNILAMRYDETQNPFPYRVLTIANGISPYFDSGAFGEDLPYFGIDLRDRNGTGVTGSTIYSIDVVTESVGGNYIPRRLYVGGRFDTISRGYLNDGNTVTKERFKNFIAIDLKLNSSNTDIAFTIPENYEQNISVPFMNYADFRTGGLVGQIGVNDAVYIVRASSGGFSGGISRTDPGLVFLGGDFYSVQLNNGTTMPARRIAVYSRNKSYVANSNQLYKIDLTQNSTPTGVQVGTAYNSSVYVKAMEYTPWRTVSSNTFDTTLVVGGNWNNATSSFDAGGGTTLTTGTDIAKLGIVNAAKNAPQVAAGPSFTSINFMQDSAYDNGLNVYMCGDFEALSSPVTNNIITLTGSTTSNTITLNRIATNNWQSIYQSAAGLSYVPKYVTRDSLTGTLLFTGVVSGSAGNLFRDKVAIKYPADNALYAANYAYGTVNVPQVSTEILSGSVELTPPISRLMQVAPLNVGRPIDLRRSTDVDYTMSIPFEEYTNTLYSAVPLQTFNCYNNGTTSVYPTISLYTPFKPNSLTSAFLHVITNVTTKQSIYLDIRLMANEFVRIRTERERISVISNIRGDITNAIFGAKKVSLSTFDDAQLFRLVPGKNVIRYGPMMPLQRYMNTGFKLSNVDYNTNRNVIVPQIIVSLSWTIGFNSIYDAFYSDINPLIL